MNNLEVRARDARWHRLNAEGKSQKEIAEEFETTQSYVSQRIKAHKDRQFNQKQTDRFAMTAALAVILPEEYAAHGSRFDAIVEDLYEEPREMLVALHNATKLLGEGLWNNIHNTTMNKSGDFVDEAFQRYAEFRSKFNDLGLRK